MPNTDYERIEKAILYLRENFREQPELEEIAAGIGVSKYHFQRLFRRWAGISPKRFLQYLTGEYVGHLLRDSHSVMDASLEAGLSGPGRLHDLVVNLHGVTPGELKAGGEGLLIRHGIHPSPFGDCLIAMTDRGVCGLFFETVSGWDQTLAEHKEQWPGARYAKDQDATGIIADRIFSDRQDGVRESMDLFVKGTNFQIKVWEALLRIPPGALVSYGDIARFIDQPKAARAVGSANAKNQVALLIPCHRVIRESGVFGEYRWGTTRKLAIFAWERARCAQVY